MLALLALDVDTTTKILAALGTLGLAVITALILVIKSVTPAIIDLIQTYAAAKKDAILREQAATQVKAVQQTMGTTADKGALKTAAVAGLREDLETRNMKNVPDAKIDKAIEAAVHDEKLRRVPTVELMEMAETINHPLLTPPKKEGT